MCLSRFLCWCPHVDTRGGVSIPLIRDFWVSIPEDAVAERVGYPSMDMVTGPAVDSIREMVFLAQTSGSPGILFAEHEFRLSGVEVQLDNGFVFSGEYLTENLENADLVVLVVMSIGAELQRQIESMSAEDPFNGFVLDAVAAYMTEAMSEMVWDGFARRYAEDGRSITSFLSPGTKDFSLQQQIVLFDILRPDRIGVQLSDSQLMWPAKSLSGIIGVGQRLLGAESAHDCSIGEQADGHLRGRK